MKILVVNAGSSSLKCSLFTEEDAARNLRSIWSEQIDWPASNKQSANARGSIGEQPTPDRGGQDRASAARALLSRLWTGENAPISHPSEIDVVGHRIVHGGGQYHLPTLISDRVVEDLHEYVQLAPSHEPINIEGIEITRGIFNDAAQIAVFDTAYHHNMPEAAFVYAGPYEWYQNLKLRRFGFHGISHQYCAERAVELVGVDPTSLRIVTCHLGSGASLAASLGDVCQMTTMGFTPIEGLVMSSRSGSLDPGMLVYLLKQAVYSVDELSDVLNYQSGLKGISGISGDMRIIEAEAGAGNKRAQLALEIYVRSISTHVSSLLPSLGGLDVLVFAGGVGENSSAVREASCKQLAFLGIDVDLEKNRNCVPDMDISSDRASIRTLVIHTREDLAIARACLQYASKKNDMKVSGNE